MRLPRMATPRTQATTPSSARERSGRVGNAARLVSRGDPAVPGDLVGLYDWHTFFCTGCGQETSVGREPRQSVEDFALMCSWLYGDPPVCSTCLGG